MLGFEARMCYVGGQDTATTQDCGEKLCYKSVDSHDRKFIFRFTTILSKK